MFVVRFDGNLGDDLMFKGKVYYGEFGDECENIASNILADRLARLQQNGIVDKRRDRSNRTRFRYTLTQKGIDLLPVMLAIVEWSQKYDEHSEVPGEFSRRLNQDRKRLTKEIIEALPRPEPAPVG